MIRFTTSHWQSAILVCGRCSRKVNGGFGDKGRTSLAKALRRQDGLGRRSKAAIGVVEAPCFKLCPRNAVVAINTARPRDWLLIAPGTEAEAVLEALGVVRGVTEPDGGAA